MIEAFVGVLVAACILGGGAVVLLWVIDKCVELVVYEPYKTMIVLLIIILILSVAIAAKG